jgi:hypothetical protein
MKIRIFLDGVLLSDWSEKRAIKLGEPDYRDSPMPVIPNVGDKITYKTFRRNNHQDNKPVDYKLVVTSIEHEIEEDWNGAYSYVAIVNTSSVVNPL